MRSNSTNPNKRRKIKLSKNKEDKSNTNRYTIDTEVSPLAQFINSSNKQFFIKKNKNLLHDYDQFLQVKNEKKKGIVFSALKKISYEERKKNETFNMYNKYPFNKNPRLIITNYKLLNNDTVEEKSIPRHKILGVDEGLIKLPKFNKDINYLFLGNKSHDIKIYDSSNEKNDNINNERMLTLNQNFLQKRKNIFNSINKNKNPMTLERGQELFSYFSNLENKYKTRAEKIKERLENSMEIKRYKSMKKQKENYENNLIYNYEIKCLDNWDFDHITKTNDLKTDNKFKKFLDEVDNSQMKWIIEIKNDKEQLKLMRRNKHLYDFLTQIDKEQQAILMQNMSLYKKGFNFDIFNNEQAESKDKDNIICKTETNNNKNKSNELLFDDDDDIPNNNVSQVEFYRQVMKEKIKLEEMFHSELRTVAEECYITNLNKKKGVIDSFEILQEINSLNKKEENAKQLYNKKMLMLHRKKRRTERKKKNYENKNSNIMLSSVSSKNNVISPFKDLKKEDSKKSTEFSEEIQSEINLSKSTNFQKQSIFLAEKNSIENEYSQRMQEISKDRKRLNLQHIKINKEVKYWDQIHKKQKSKLEQRIKALSTYYYQILKKGIDVRHNGLTWVIVKLLELGAFVDKPHFPSFLNSEQILYLMKTGTKTYELSELVKLFQILKKKQKALREKHINDNIEKEKMNQLKDNEKNLKKRKNKNFQIGNDYMEYIEEIQRKYENVINICLNENKEESNIAKISYDLKQYILQDKNEHCKDKSDKKLELLFIPGSLSEYFVQDKRFRQYFDDVFYLNDEINKRRDILNKEKQDYLNHYKNNYLRGALFGTAEDNSRYKRKKNTENEIIYAALFGNGISI